MFYNDGGKNSIRLESAWDKTAEGKREKG